MWSLKCEHTADRGGLIATKDMESAANSLIKMSTGSMLSKEINWKKMTENYNDRNFFVDMTELLGSHPFPIKRIKEIELFSNSKKYLEAISNN